MKKGLKFENTGALKKTSPFVQKLNRNHESFHLDSFVDVFRAEFDTFSGGFWTQHSGNSRSKTTTTTGKAAQQFMYGAEF